MKKIVANTLILLAVTTNALADPPQQRSQKPGTIFDILKEIGDGVEKEFKKVTDFTSLSVNSLDAVLSSEAVVVTQNRFIEEQRKPYLTETGSVFFNLGKSTYAYGTNINGELGIGEESYEPSSGLTNYKYPKGVINSPQKLGLENIIQIVANYNSALFLTEDGKVFAVGPFSSYIHATDGNGFVPVPTEIKGLSGIVKIASRSGTYYALHRSGKLIAWGASAPTLGRAQGDLGTRSPYKLYVVSGLDSLIDIAATFSGYVALDSNGNVYVRNLVDPQSHNPTKINIDEPVEKIFAGSGDVVHAITLSGKAYGWGDEGALLGNGGYNTNTNRHAPVRIPELDGCSKIKAGNGFYGAICGVESEFKIWGSNGSFPFKDGDDRPKNYPRTLSNTGGSNYISIGVTAVLLGKSNGEFISSGLLTAPSSKSGTVPTRSPLARTQFQKIDFSRILNPSYDKLDRNPKSRQLTEGAISSVSNSQEESELLELQARKRLAGYPNLSSYRFMDSPFEGTHLFYKQMRPLTGLIVADDLSKYGAFSDWSVFENGLENALDKEASVKIMRSYLPKMRPEVLIGPFGTGKNRIIVVSAPDCPNCVAFEKYIGKNLKALNARLYIIPTTLAPGATLVTNAIACAPDPKKAWNDAMTNRIPPDTSRPICDRGIQLNFARYATYSFNSSSGTNSYAVPMFILPDGSVTAGWDSDASIYEARKKLRFND